MKSLITFRFSLILVLFLMPALNMKAAEMETLTWERFGIEFDVPSGARVTENTKDSFAAEFADFYIRMTLFEPHGSDTAVVEEMLEEIADKMGVDIIDQGKLDQNNLTGSWVEGPSDKGGMMLMAIVTNKDSRLAILCELLYSEGLGDYADKVLDSIRFVPQKVNKANEQK